MTDISVTAANVVPQGNAVISRGTAGVTITAGQTVYKETASGKYKLADSDAAGEIKTLAGIALNGAGAGQPLAVCTSGDVAFGAIFTAGSPYYLSETPGGIQPAADLAGEDVVQIGLAKTTSILTVRIQIPGVTLA